ncbi:MAG: recombinase family protein [Acholeplasmataceae bacterium]|nr:recombinase family protein [Acholeplasmataceae bacterium]
MRQIVEIIEPKPKYKDFITNQVIRKKKVAAYARVSTDETDQLHSYQAQIEEFTQRINKNDEWEFAGLYCDEGITGTMMSKRPGFLSMIQAAEDGHIDLILTKSISRFSRNTIDILTVIQTLRNIDVEIYFEKENLSSLDPKIDFILTVMSSMAQEESRSISENTKWGIQKRFEQGKLIMNTNRFLGYDKDTEGTLIINEEQAKTVKYIFHKYLNGMSVTSLARHLTDEKIKNGLGRVNWYADTVKEILMNEKYAGDLMLQKTVTIDYLTHQAVINDGHATKYYIKNAHEPIIDRETFDIVQTMIHARDVILAEDSKERFKHLAQKPMKGLVYCSRCHRIYNSKMHNSGTTFKKSMLKCHTSRNNPHDCDNPSIHEPLLERATLHVIERLTQTKDMQKSIMNYMKETLEQTNSHEPLKALKHEYVEIGNQIKALSKNQLHSNMTDSEYKNEFKRLEQNLKETERNIENLTNQIKKEHLMRRRYYALESFIQTNFQDLTIIKSFFGLVLIMGKNHVRYVIDDTFSTIDDLHHQIDTIKKTPSILEGTYFDYKTKENIYYEVTIHEGN